MASTAVPLAPLPAVFKDAVLKDAVLKGSAARAAATLKTGAELERALGQQNAERVLALGVPALDAALPQRGLLQGSITELQVRGASGAATSFALCACRAAQQRGSLAGTRPWCAFIDPSASLFAPGVARLGVELGRLLVLRPELDAVERIAVRIAEAKAVALLVVDLRGALGNLVLASQRWQRAVRRLALAIENLATSVLLLTSAEPRQALPLPVAMRLELVRASARQFELRVGKERSGRVTAPRLLPFSTFESSAFASGAFAPVLEAAS